MPKVVKIVYNHIYKLFCSSEICQMHKETTINDKNNTKVIAKLHQVHFKVKIAKKVKISLFIKFNSVSEAINYYKDWFCDIIG